MNDPSAVRAGSCSAGTSHVGPLGSTVHVLRADAGTIAELAAIETRDERKEAVSRIVRRRQQASFRIREEEAPYPVAQG